MKKFIYALLFLGLLISIFTTLFFYTKVRERNYYENILLKEFDNYNCKDRIDTVLTISKLVYKNTGGKTGYITKDEMTFYDRWEATSFFNVSVAVALKHKGWGVVGYKVFGPCGTMSREVLSILWKLKIPARKLLLVANEYGKGGGHALLEFQYNSKWMVLSPSDSTFCWKNHDGMIASAAEIKNDTAIL